jgi:nickel-dependent lactate racemase
MQIAWGQQIVNLDIPADRLVPLRRADRPAPIADLAAAVREALEHPFEFPALRLALTPDDRVVIAIEPNMPHVGVLLTATLEHLSQARIEPAAITLLCLDANQDQSWINSLPDEFQEVHIETHRPGDRKLLAYLATTKGGRRIYLNRSLVDADQTVILTQRRYDTLLGHGGGAGVIFPGLCETEAADAIRAQISLAAPSAGSWKLKHEADEVAWYLGAPFFVQVIEGNGGDILYVVGGAHEARRHGERLLDNAWHVTADEPADLVIAAISGPPASHSFATIAHAALNASRVLRPGGRIVVLTDAEPDLGPALQMIRNEEEPHAARQRIVAEKPSDLEAGYLWASVAEKAKLYLLSRLPIETTEELYATPLERPGQAQKLIAAAQRVIVLPDAHRTLASLKIEAQKREGGKAQ